MWHRKKSVFFIDGFKRQHLALYIFSNYERLTKKLITNHAFSLGKINGTLVHFANYYMPFGGVGLSGMGSYYGKHSFDIFTCEKGIIAPYNRLDYSALCALQG